MKKLIVNIGNIVAVLIVLVFVASIIYGIAYIGPNSVIDAPALSDVSVIMLALAGIFFGFKILDTIDSVNEFGRLLTAILNSTILAFGMSFIVFGARTLYTMISMQ